ncbi:MAG: M28 family peptidase [Planctomycetota bacterium]|nr:M28 family peptidase [Planctomycetota bacterium]
MNTPRNLKTGFHLVLVLFIFGASYCGTIASGQRHGPRLENPEIERLFKLVRKAYRGSRAYDTTAYVEKYWRVPGNKGFNRSIERVESILKRVGYVPEEDSLPDDRLTYRIERRPMRQPTWEPGWASLTIVGEKEPLLTSETNRHLLLMYSHSLPTEGLTARLVDVGNGTKEEFEALDVKGAIVLGARASWSLHREAVLKREALGILAYAIPDFNRSFSHPESIPFSGLPYDAERKPWGMNLNRRAYEDLKQRLDEGDVSVRVEMQSRIYESEELTIIAQIKGSVKPEQEFVFSAHVQEPGANDNASGVGCQAEMARVAAILFRDGAIDPQRTITFLWGDEITSTRRYVQAAQPGQIQWGLSLDMVGEDTSKTGGTFLIEKMPDPSAVWPRGEDKFSEWGGRPITLDRMKPHYFNDYIIYRCLDQAEATGWVVKTNPFEGGSDHVPFLQGDIPAVLMWHFTDVYYHTDGDRIENVSPKTLTNVGVSALVSALSLASADSNLAEKITMELALAAMFRILAESTLTRAALRDGADPRQERAILEAWTRWYRQAIKSCEDIPVHVDEDWEAKIQEIVEMVMSKLDKEVEQLFRDHPE